MRCPIIGLELKIDIDKRLHRKACLGLPDDYGVESGIRQNYCRLH
jgi:hypothetical protein